MAWERLVNYSTMFPPYYLMQRAFEDYRFNPHPAGHEPSNQCAVRMSLALGRCGFSLDAFPHRGRVVKSKDLPVPYVQGANELAKYLRDMWGLPLKLHKMKGSVSAASLFNKKGVIYFDNCFYRNGDLPGHPKGDHIDLWNGQHYYNDIYKIPPGREDRYSLGNMFEKAAEVWFFELF